MNIRLLNCLSVRLSVCLSVQLHVPFTKDVRDFTILNMSMGLNVIYNEASFLVESESVRLNTRQSKALDVSILGYVM